MTMIDDEPIRQPDPIDQAAELTARLERYGIEAARAADATFVASGAPIWHSPSFIVAALLIPLVYMVVGAVVGLFGTPFSEDVRAAIANGIVGVILGGLIGYYYGQSTSRNRSTAGVGAAE